MWDKILTCDSESQAVIAQLDQHRIFDKNKLQTNEEFTRALTALDARDFYIDHSAIKRFILAAMTRSDDALNQTIIAYRKAP